MQKRLRNSWIVSVLTLLVALLGCCAAGAEDIEELDANAEAQAHSDADIAENGGESSEATREDVLADVALGEARKCVNSQRIRRTEILDDRTVVFHMSGSDKYLNRLRSRCFGLRTSDSFSYELRTPQLCDLDLIRVVDYFGGNIRSGVSCGLGKFQSVTEEQLEILRERGGDES